MASTPEKKVKLAVSKLLKAKGVYHFYPVTGGYGSSGVPDIVACARGRFIGIECKAAAGRPTALQEKNLIDIKNSGGLFFIVTDAPWSEWEVAPIVTPQEFGEFLETFLEQA